MSRIKYLAAVAAAAGLFFSAGASAEIVLGGSLISSEFDYEDIGHGTGKKFFAGYHSRTSPILVEVALIDTGEADVESLGDVTIAVDGFNVSVGWNGILNPSTGSSVWLKGGLYSTDTTVRGPGGQVSDSGSGLSFGLGGDWKFSPSVGLRFDLESLLGVKDFAEDKNVTLASLGLVFAIPNQK